MWMSWLTRRTFLCCPTKLNKRLAASQLNQKKTSIWSKTSREAQRRYLAAGDEWRRRIAVTLHETLINLSSIWSSSSFVKHIALKTLAQGHDFAADLGTIRQTTMFLLIRSLNSARLVKAPPIKWVWCILERLKNLTKWLLFKERRCSIHTRKLDSKLLPESLKVINI